uniref:Uncharacterized protein n=1 Tax=Trichogramma kaykai TaxID=54128 RepID=A0ABD2X8U2_9HYME
MRVLLTIGFLKIKRIDNNRLKNIFQDLRERSYGACIQIYNALSVASGVIKKIIAPHPLVLSPSRLGSSPNIRIHARALQKRKCEFHAAKACTHKRYEFYKKFFYIWCVRAAAKLGLGIVCLDLSRRSRLFLKVRSY